MIRSSCRGSPFGVAFAIWTKDYWLILIAVFVVTTSPVSAMLVMRAAVQRELAKRAKPDGAEAPPP